MTTGTFKYMDPTTIVASDVPFIKPWTKVDSATTSYEALWKVREVTNMRDAAAGELGTDVSGFALHHWPAREKEFGSDAAVRDGYYGEVEQLLRAKLPASPVVDRGKSGGGGGSAVSKVVVFDHTIRRHDAASPRQPVHLMHVDQTPAAAVARVRRHLPADEADALLVPRGRRFQIVNVWRPVGHAAADQPLAVVDWRSTRPEHLVAVDILYPTRAAAAADDDDDDDDRGKEVLPDAASPALSTHGYEVKGETYGVVPSERHRFYYAKDMTPDEALFIKCFDSWSQGQPDGIDGIAAFAPHTAFTDPATPDGAHRRQSIEVRCLVIYE